MNKEKLRQAKLWTEQELERCVSFWLKNGMDREFGGVYTCLDRTGRIYSTCGCRAAAAGSLPTCAMCTA